MLGDILGIEGSGHLAEAIVLLRLLLHLLARRHLRLRRDGLSHILSTTRGLVGARASACNRQS